MGRNFASLGRQGPPLGHAEPVLLVGNHQAQLVVGHRLGEEGVGAHQHLDFSPLQLLEQLFPYPSLHRPGEQGYLHPYRLQNGGQGAAVLLGQQFRGGHEGALQPAEGGTPGPVGGHRRLAGTHIPLHQAVHTPP